MIWKRRPNPHREALRRVIAWEEYEKARFSAYQLARPQEPATEDMVLIWLDPESRGYWRGYNGLEIRHE